MTTLEMSDMRRTILTVVVLASSFLSASVAMAQRACVLDRDGYVVCGQLVKRGYEPPHRNDDRRRSYDRRDDRQDRRSNDRRRAQPKRCPRNYTVQDGVCKPYRAPPKCKKNYTLQDGVCKPYTGR